MRTRYTKILLSLGLLFALTTVSLAQTEMGSPSVAPATQTPQNPDLAVFEEVLQLVQEHFYDATLHGLDWTAIGDKYRPLVAATAGEERAAVLNRMLAELSASHTRYYTAAEPAYYQLLDIFSGALRRKLPQVFAGGHVTYPGIGILTREIEGKTFVSGVLAGLPAAESGLLTGDELLTVNGSPYHAIQSFAATVGQPVTLQIRRAASAPPQEVVVTPKQMRPNEAFLQAMQASARVINVEGASIGYIHVWSYAGSQYQQLLERELSSGTLKEADALVLDLRDGWGGAQAHYLDLLSAQGPTVTMRERDGELSVTNFKWRKPVVLLVNDGTRSGKEILAYGFKKYGLGEIVGTRTAGFVLAGRAFLLSDHSLLLLAVADVLVDGQRLEGVGVTPTIEVPFPLEYAQGKDPQLERAVEVLAQAVRG